MLFQPLALAAGDREPLRVGAVASRLTVTLSDAVPPADVAEHVNVVPAVSAVTVVEPQPEGLRVDSGSVTFQDTPTSKVYQPLLPCVPVTVRVMTGGVVSIDVDPR